MTMFKYEFHESNSGGYHRLSEKNYRDLHAAGWSARMYCFDADQDETDIDQMLFDGLSRPYMSKEFPTIRAAVEEWEKITGQDFFEQGCTCCGPPFRLRSEGGGSISSWDCERRAERPW